MADVSTLSLCCLKSLVKMSMLERSTMGTIAGVGVMPIFAWNGVWACQAPEFRMSVPR